ncbi:esterase-like activity of phytase family protein [uncultured Meiothermus sp.]|uniref:esterase-like activity of phytase family protein n=1 Tax=uncultured Meiothermus sp. TaxID=157471 RepID=UPI00262A2F23|nr:esterase-like activity of phytase family protein [uncultured Meiothermus sp.]
MHKFIFTIAGLVLGLVGLAQPPRSELVGFAELPAETFVPGPPSGAFRATPGIRAAQAPFSSQPVQGFSAVQLGPRPGTFWMLADNGFGSKANSPDFLLRIYQVTPQPRTAQGGAGGVLVNRFIQLRDPNRRIPFPILNENTPDRRLTGYDFDPESLVVAADGSFWVGEEFGPFLLHFDANGVLLAPPIATPDFGAGRNPVSDQVRAPEHPSLIINPVAPGQPWPANLPRTRGFEGMTSNPARSRIFAMLEGTVVGDPAGTVRLMEVDPVNRRFVGLVGRYPLDDPGHAIGEIAVINENEYLVIERDGRQGDEALFKRIFRIDLTRRDANGVFVKELLVDLLNIADPRGLSRHTREGNFRFPFFTIEAVIVLDANTILVTNDNNFPATGGRGAEVRDPNEFIWLRLPTPLQLAPGVGQSR